MSIQMMREYLCASYNGSAWEQKVMKMSDKQVIAVYYSVKERRGK